MAEKDYISDETADRILGAFLVICTTLGIYGNSLALLYFKKEKSNSGNSLFHQKCYAIISGVDLLICLAQIPVVQSLIVGRWNENVLFQDETLCYIWGGSWTIVQPLSIYMITLLSFARFFVLIYPFRRLPLWLPCRFLYAGLIILILLSTAPVLSGKFDIYYNEKEVHCFVHPRRARNQNPKYKYYIDPTIVTIIWSGFLCLPLLPTWIAFVMSVFLVERAKKSEIVTSSTRNHWYKSRTIQILTFVCLISSMPIAGYGVYQAVNFSDLSNDGISSQPKLQDFYVGLVAQDVITTINCAIKPAIYLLRVRSFRRYVGKWRSTRTSIVSRISTLSLTPGELPLFTRLSKISSMGQISSRLSFFLSSTTNPAPPSDIELTPRSPSPEKRDS